MAYQSEAALEQQFIEQLNKQEYSTVFIPDYDALVANFKVQFETFNAAKLDTPLTEKEWERIFNLMLGKSVFQSAKILRDKFVLEREDGTKVYLSFFDNDHTKNIFQVTNQTTVVGKYVNRYDVTILVNGLPLIQIELKRRGIDIREAVNQVMRYKKHSYNGLYHFIQLFVVSNGVDTKYFANSDRDLLYSLAFFWTDFNNVRITNLKDFSISFLARDHIIKMLTRYTILNDTDTVMTIAVAKAFMDARQDATDEEIHLLLKRSMRELGKAFPYAGYGGMFRCWLEDEQMAAYGSYGNGSAMRVSSVAWLYNELSDVRHAAKLSAEVTHNHPEGIKGAEATASAIFLARTGHSKQEIKDYVEEEFGYVLNRTCDEIRPTYHHVESCMETVPEALTAFLEGNSFEDVIRTAVSLGGDCDTLTAIAGSVAEGFYGVPQDLQEECYKRLPERLRATLRSFQEFVRTGLNKGKE